MASIRSLLSALFVGVVLAQGGKDVDTIALVAPTFSSNAPIVSLAPITLAPLAPVTPVAPLGSVCPDGHRCYNGSMCTQNPNDEGNYYCDCDESHAGEIYAGLFCEYKATSYCASDLELSKISFCTNEGQCKGGADARGMHLGCDCEDDYEGEHCQFVLGTKPIAQPPTFLPSSIPSSSPVPSLAPTAACVIGCPGAPDIENGLATAQDLNCQIQYDWNQGDLEPPIYRLCPNTIYSVTDVIEIMLSNTQLLCGNSGELSDNCIISGGSNEQIAVRNLESVSIRGITFQTDNVQVSVYHEGGTLFIQDCQWSGNGRVMTSRSALLTRLVDCAIRDSNITGTMMVARSRGIVKLERLTIQNTTVGEDLVRVANSALTIQECDFLDNQADRLLIVAGQSNLFMLDTAFEANHCANGLVFEDGLNVAIEGCTISNNKFTTTLLSSDLNGGKSMFISNSKISNNTGGYSVANIKGTARFDFIVFEQNVAQIGIEVYNELTLDEVTWTTNEAEWHLYVRPGGSLLVGSDSVISLNQATNGIFYLERKAICEVTNTEVKWNNVTEFHLISVLESSELKMIESTFVDNTVANSLLYVMGSSQAIANQVSFTQNIIGKSLLRATSFSTLTAKDATISDNIIGENLAVGDTGSTITITGSEFRRNTIAFAMLFLNTTSIAAYARVVFEMNQGGAAKNGMLECVGSTLSLDTVEAQANRFDSFAVALDESALKASVVSVVEHEGLSLEEFSGWEVFLIANRSSLVLSDSQINNTISFAHIHVRDKSVATITGFQIEGLPALDGTLENYGIVSETGSNTTLQDVCFLGGEYTNPVWSYGGVFVGNNVFGTDIVRRESISSSQCSAIWLDSASNGECVTFDGLGCGEIPTPAPITTAPVPTTPQPVTTLAPVPTTPQPVTTLAPVPTTPQPVTTMAPVTTLAPTTAMPSASVAATAASPTAMPTSMPTTARPTSDNGSFFNSGASMTMASWWWSTIVMAIVLAVVV